MAALTISLFVRSWYHIVLTTCLCATLACVNACVDVSHAKRDAEHPAPTQHASAGATVVSAEALQ